MMQTLQDMRDEGKRPARADQDRAFQQAVIRQLDGRAIRAGRLPKSGTHPVVLAPRVEVGEELSERAIPGVHRQIQPLSRPPRAAFPRPYNEPSQGLQPPERGFRGISRRPFPRALHVPVWSGGPRKASLSVENRPRNPTRMLAVTRIQAGQTLLASIARDSVTFKEPSALPLITKTFDLPSSAGFVPEVAPKRCQHPLGSAALLEGGEDDRFLLGRGRDVLLRHRPRSIPRAECCFPCKAVLLVQIPPAGAHTRPRAWRSARRRGAASSEEGEPRWASGLPPPLPAGPLRRNRAATSSRGAIPRAPRRGGQCREASGAPS